MLIFSLLNVLSCARLKEISKSNQRPLFALKKSIIRFATVILVSTFSLATLVQLYAHTAPLFM